MRHFAKALLLVSLCIGINTGQIFAQEKINIIPIPVSVKQTKGQIVFPKLIHISGEQSLSKSLDVLKERLVIASGYQVKITAANAFIKLFLNKNYDTTIDDEGYRLTTNKTGVTISANKPAGIYYGVQSLLQLLPPQIESAVAVKDMKLKVPFVEIVDYPKLGWRGFLFDPVRHFFTKEEVKKFVNTMSRYKFNLLHFHLSDDHGWRIEIKSYPKLTEVGAWNVKMEGHFGDFPDPAPDAKRNFGGFYTQEDIKEIVKYAKEHFVNVMPEIDVPGHSLAINASYPELSCFPELPKHVASGENIGGWQDPKLKMENTLCPANENVYVFLEKLISELTRLFPFEYIHMGGDEGNFAYWKESKAVAELMKRENLKDMKEVQGYFERRVDKIVNKAGRKMIGWDEILETNVSQSAAIMSWTGEKAGIHASQAGHKVVMTPTDYAYLDFMQGDIITEPRVYRTLRLNKTYQFNPSPDGAKKQNIMGGQGNLWSEQIFNFRQLEYMAWPRGFAIIESLWSPLQNKNWKDFVKRTEDHFERMDYRKVKYSRAMYDPEIVVKKGDDDKPVVKLSTELNDLDIYYSFDDSSPDNYYPKYTEPISFPIGSERMRMITYRNGKPIGRMMTLTLEDAKSRMKK